VKFKKLAEALETVKSLQHENVFSERRNQFPDASILGDAHGIPLMLQAATRGRYPTATA
jgi:hypothetical protein